jgi:hypothetical protein
VAVALGLLALLLVTAIAVAQTMSKPVDSPLGQTRVRKIVLTVGANRLELEGEGILLTAPVVFDLITKIFAAGASPDPADVAKMVALTKSLADSTTPLADSVAANTPQT